MKTSATLSMLCAASLVAVAACAGSGGSVPSTTDRNMSAGRFASLASFTVTSKTFSNLGRVPPVMVQSQFGCHGGNQSPQLSWRNAPAGTRSFAIVMFDQTANFGHWGMYNVSSETTSLPQNAGASTAQGIQVNSDFGTRGYGGPCPPAGVDHRYVVTIYALDRTLYISSSPNFPSNVESVLWSMAGHVLASATITGFYST